MKERKFKEKTESQIEEEKEECVLEIIKPKKNNFYFIVRSTFGDYKKGDKIEDEEAIESIIESGFTCRVIKVFHK